MRIYQRSCLLLLIIQCLYGLKHVVHESLTKDQPYFVFSEGFMYASQRGPFLMPKGSSTIEIHANISSIWSKNTSCNANILILTNAHSHSTREVLSTICNKQATQKTVYAYGDAQYIQIPTLYRSCDSVKGTCVYGAEAKEIVSVGKAGSAYVYVYVCYDEVQYTASLQPQTYTSPMLVVEGNVNVKNPYGYLPGMLYGMLPVSMCLCMAYILVLGYYSIHYAVYQAYVQPIHTLLLCMGVLALLESVVWVVHYIFTNVYGAPPCCPLPLYLVLLNLLCALNNTVQICVCMLVCLGYGLGRAKLLRVETFFITLLGLVYGAIGLVGGYLYIHHLHSDTFIHRNDAGVYDEDVYGGVVDITYTTGGGVYTTLSMLYVLCMAVAYAYMYVSIHNTTRILSNFKQQEKLKYYVWVWRVGCVCVAVIAVMTVLYILDMQGVIDFPGRQVLWLRGALFDFATLAIISSLCIIFTPTEHSTDLVHHSQLPAYDPDEDTYGMDVRRHGEEDDDDVEMVHVPRKVKTEEDGGEYGLSDDYSDS